MSGVPIGLGSRRVSLHLGRRDLLSLPPPRARPVDVAALAARALDALPRGARRVCLVVPDRTRAAAADVVVGALADQLGPVPCVFASGTHAPMTDDEMRGVLGAAAERVRRLAHDCDAPALVDVGTGARVHPAVAEADAVVVVGAMSFHYLAGFGGGRKMLLPGVGDRATATAIHQRCLTTSPPGRAPFVAPGFLDENPLHQAILARLGPLAHKSAGITVVLEGGALVDGEAGGLLEHHATLARRFAEGRTLERDARYGAVVLSCGGAPFDIDLVQAHKALHAIAPLVDEGGRIAFLAELGRGLGHREMRAWLTSGTPEQQLERLLASFAIGEQTAWSLRNLLGRFEVGLVSALDDDEVRALGMRPLLLDDVAAFVGERARVAIAPHGAALRYVLTGSAPR